MCMCMCVYVYELWSVITELDHADVPYEPAIATPLPLRDLHSTFQKSKKQEYFMSINKATLS